MNGMTYVKFYPSDWRSGCFVLSIEEEGLYSRAVMFMYDTGQAIPGNDSVAARLLNVQVQKYQKVMASLIEKGKMIRAQGVIINDRVLEELDRYKSEQVARSEAAKRREEERKVRIAKAAMDGVQKLKDDLKAAAGNAVQDGCIRAQPPHQPPHQPPPGCLGGTPEVPLDVMAKKLKEINETDTTAKAEVWQTLVNPYTSKEREDIESKKDSPNGLVNLDKKDDLQLNDAVDLYNATAKRCGLAAVAKLTDKRRKALKARLKEHGMDGWRTALGMVEQSAFLTGKSGGSWKASFDFLLQPDKLTRCIEGVYGNGRHSKPTYDEAYCEFWRRELAD